MQTPSTIILNQFKFSLTQYARSYYNLYGVKPTGRPLKNMVAATIDEVEDAKIRTQLRKALKVVKITINNETCTIAFLIEKKVLKFFDRYLG